MEILPKNFNKKGFVYLEVRRTGDIGLYFKTKPETSIKNWEVVKIQSHNGYFIGDLEIKAKEYLPKDEDWGDKGWSYCNIESAEKKFNSLLKTA